MAAGPKFWSLTPAREPEDPNAKFEISHTDFHPCVRPHRLPTRTTRVRGTAEKRATVRAITEAGGRISKVKKVWW